MIVASTPGKDLVYTNYAYCSHSDLRRFAVPGSNSLFLALVGDANGFVLSVSYPFNFALIVFTFCLFVLFSVVYLDWSGFVFLIELNLCEISFVAIRC